ncbi:FkbM family methyltransferase [Dysgonomonas sp. 25]|uniref:FkbM family methyltransferase n=1 Tax=Dysgonomonas sp. 25 TaxID=2302933 RepID=UPI0013D00F5A|nr:FkbM family methyltransferase [Dysgonomonas sp. 25]NDV69040.1 FkbM family methyltransferase [Dysgonomonas sp. 25]
MSKINKIIYPFYKFAVNIKTNKPYKKKLGINSSEMNRLRKESGPLSTFLFGKKIDITNFFWYIHGLNEIFLDETYRFHSKKETPLILDCGANVGLSAIYFKRLYPKAQVIAFEADQDIAKTLSSNLHSFGFDDVEIVSKAVWTANTTLEFMSDGAVGGQIVEGREGSTKIEAIRLRDYLEKEVDFLKIDIEGVEYDILKDCADKLINVKNLFIEYHSFLNNEQKLDEILLVLKKAGFKYYIKEAWNNMPMPFVDSHQSHYDLQLNIFAYRL